MPPRASAFQPHDPMPEPTELDPTLREPSPSDPESAPAARLVRRTHTSRVLEPTGAFAGLFQLDDGIRLLTRKYRDPVLVTTTSSVTAEPGLVTTAGHHRALGADLVARAVNDAVCTGAEPLFFADGLTTATADAARDAAYLEGLSDACVEADCALIARQVSRAPAALREAAWHASGFCLGVVERRAILDGSEIRPGDRIVGLASAGLNPGPAAALREAVLGSARSSPSAVIPALGRTLADELASPTPVYARAFRSAARHYRVKRVVHGMVHLAHAGLFQAPARLLRPGLCASLIPDSWPIPPIVRWLESTDGGPAQQLERTLNLGLGLLLFVAPYYADAIVRSLNRQARLPAWIVGEVVEGPFPVAWHTKQSP